MSETFTVSGVDQIEALVREQYLSARLTAAEPNPAFTVTQTAVGPLRVGRHIFDMTLTAAAEPLGAIAIVQTRSGRVTHRSRSEERMYRAGELFLNAHPADTFTSSIDHLDADFAMFDPTLLGDVAHPERGEAGPVHLTGYAPVSGRAAQQWRATFEFARDTAAQPDLSPLLVGSISRLLAACTLTTFPSNASLDPSAKDRRDAHPDSIRRAVAFIESHPDRDLTVVDIARAAYVTPRALQLAFRRHLDTTPMTYLRRVRLDRAHTDLQAADPSTATVTAVAARWGFTASQFSAYYRSAYGRSPHHTLCGDG